LRQQVFHAYPPTAWWGRRLEETANVSVQRVPGTLGVERRRSLLALQTAGMVVGKCMRKVSQTQEPGRDRALGRCSDYGIHQALTEAARMLHQVNESGERKHLAGPPQ